MAHQALSRGTGLAWSHPVPFGLYLAKKNSNFWSPGCLDRCLAKMAPSHTFPSNWMWYGISGPFQVNWTSLEPSRSIWSGFSQKYYGYFWSIGVAIRRRDTKNINNYWHWWFGPILSNFGCLEVSFAESSLLSLTPCFRGTSSFGPKTAKFGPKRAFLAKYGLFWPIWSDAQPKNNYVDTKSFTYSH